MRVLVTGAGRGLGLEMARQWAAAGDRVFASARRPGPALTALVAAHPGQVTIVELDVTDDDSIARAADSVADATDALDVVVNNAAVHPKGASLGSYRRDEVAAVFGANTIGPLLVGQALLPLLRRGERPRLVNISTQVGSFTWNTGGKSPLYAASKAALNMFTRSMAREAAGVVVVAVHPGWVKTDMGGASAPLSPSASVKDLRTLIDRLQPSDTGQFFNHDGHHHPW